MDFLSDMIARLKNGQRVGKRSIDVKQNKLCLKVLQILQNEGFISHYTLIVSSSKKQSKLNAPKKIKVYFKRKAPLGNNTMNFYSHDFHISPVSKRSRRVYMAVKNLWKLEQGLGIYILSTSRGLLTDREARNFKVGGEILCKVRLQFNFIKISFQHNLLVYFILN